MKYLISITSILIVFTICGFKLTNTVQEESNSQLSPCKSALGHPFGTLLKLEVEIIDGDSTKIHEYSKEYLMKVLSVNGKKYNGLPFISFTDESSKFPESQYELAQRTKGGKKGNTSSMEFKKLHKEYVGKRFRLIAFESGSFVGLPDSVFTILPQTQTTSFYFKNHLVIISTIK